MAIVSVAIASESGSSPRVIRYVATDDSGGTHVFGPVIAHDPRFDADAFRASVATRLEESLAEAEFEELIG